MLQWDMAGLRHSRKAAPVGFAYNLDAKPSSQVTFVSLERDFFHLQIEKNYYTQVLPQTWLV